MHIVYHFTIAILGAEGGGVYIVESSHFLDHTNPKCVLYLLPPACFCKTVGGIVLGSVAVSAISADVLLYISVAIKASFLKLGMCNICKNNIAKMCLDFF